jgi:hypothetical protein
MNQAKDAVSALVLKYVARASVAVPFVIALGFAIAAVSVMLVEHFGHVTAYWIMGPWLAAIGVIAAIAVTVKEHEEEVAAERAEASDTQEAVSDATSQAMVQAPLALLGALFTAPGGASTAIKVAGILGRNYPPRAVAGADRSAAPANRQRQDPGNGSSGPKTQRSAARRYLSLAPTLWQPFLAWQFRHSRPQGVPP